MNLFIIGSNDVLIEAEVNSAKVIFKDGSVWVHSKDDTNNLVVNLSEIKHLNFE